MMAGPPDYMYSVSEALSEVMDDLGVNESIVMKRRRSWLLMDTISRILKEDSVYEEKCYHFGSQSEGSTTPGLNSDIDVLTSSDICNAIQDLIEWIPGVINYMMIQNENISPGYCYLQIISPDQPLPVTVNEVVPDTYYGLLKYCVSDREGRYMRKKMHNHGPAITIHSQPGAPPTDTVSSFLCKSFPYQAIPWLQKQRQGKWPTEDVLEACRNAGCFMVPVGSKVHSPDVLERHLEWRISTSIQERYLMFSLNIPQMKCYTLMKMILKSHINPHVEDVLSSFMCKNVLLYCIANSSHDFHTGNLLSYLHLCLFMLKECIRQRNCPHFIIPDNNLLAGHMSDTQMVKLLDIIYTLIKNDEQLLFEVKIDALGRRLKMKLNIIPYCPSIPSATLISQVISGNSVYPIAKAQGFYLTLLLKGIKHESLKSARQYLSKECTSLERYSNEGELQHTTVELLIPLVCSTLGSVMASTDINAQLAISDEAFTYLEAGKRSDALSGRLKLVSVLYCTGNMERICRELSNIRTHYNISEVHTVCSCCSKALSVPKLGGVNNFKQYNEKAIKTNVALCTTFLQCEINCVPQELRYEILRSYVEEDRQMRTAEDSRWMDLIVIDSIPYLFFLHYKVFKHQQRRVDQQKSLCNISLCINVEPNIHHEETALNVLGQCFEQENRQTEALACYMRSLQHRMRNNAARFLLCLQLNKLWKQDHSP